MNKFGKIEEFIESMEVEEVNESEKALLLVGSTFGGSGTNNNCVNGFWCAGSSNSGTCINMAIC